MTSHMIRSVWIEKICKGELMMSSLSYQQTRVYRCFRGIKMLYHIYVAWVCRYFTWKPKGGPKRSSYKHLKDLTRVSPFPNGWNTCNVLPGLLIIMSQSQEGQGHQCWGVNPTSEKPTTRCIGHHHTTANNMNYEINNAQSETAAPTTHFGDEQWPK